MGVEPRTADANVVVPSPLLEPTWHYVHKVNLDEIDAEEWTMLRAQRSQFQAVLQATAVLDMLRAGATLPSYGYEINNYLHCLQTATLVMRAGYGEEDIVVALLHDIGFIVAPMRHGEFAAELLEPYISPKNQWMLRMHALVQERHIHDGHELSSSWETITKQEHFEWTREFVERFDQYAISASSPIYPLSEFEPIVQEFFGKRLT